MTQITGEGEASPAHTGARLLDGQVAPSVDEWLETLSETGEIGQLLRVPWAEQIDRGYGHTLREICQQPLTWLETATTLQGRAPCLERSIDGVESVVLTGSGSSFYAAECVAPCLQHALGRPAAAVPAGRILTHPEVCLPPSGPYLVVSLARSGNSPESGGAVDWLLETQPQARHLVITCNRNGALATSYEDDERVQCVVLDEKTDDKSLVMTSSFTNLVLAAGALGTFKTGRCPSRATALARLAASVLTEHGDALAEVGRQECPSVVYLGSGCRLGSAREAALKVLEMTAGKVPTMAESFLGLRHGPMSALREDTLVVAFLSSSPLVRAYELDLLRELDRKGLCQRRVIVGTEVPAELVERTHELVIDCGASTTCDDDLTVIDVLVGQLLAFFRCRAVGLRPDSPSTGGVITRVVSEFEIHRRDRTG
jgi:tagatose-6-phosphate ketose/aldose isomerase